MKGNGATRGGAAQSRDAGYEGAVGVLDEALSKINALGATDRAALVKIVLKDNDIDFPGRVQWEERLMAGRDTYVTYCRRLNRAMKQLLAQAKALHEANPDMKEDDPRALSLVTNFNEISQEAQRLDSDFQKLLDEGPALAKQAQGKKN